MSRFFCPEDGGRFFFKYCLSVFTVSQQSSTLPRCVSFEVRRSRCVALVLRSGVTCGTRVCIQVQHCWVTFRRQVFQDNSWLLQSRERSDCRTNCESTMYLLRCIPRARGVIGALNIQRLQKWKTTNRCENMFDISKRKLWQFPSRIAFFTDGPSTDTPS